jgi:hypothetical protein
LEIILYAIVAILAFRVFSRYKYRPRLERFLETRSKTVVWQDALFLGIFVCAIAFVFAVWHRLYPGQAHHIGYFLVFLPGSILTLILFRVWVAKVDLMLCVPSIILVWILLLIFESTLLTNNAGWVYTDSTVLTFHLGSKISIILENLIFFYAISPFVSILVFTALAHNRSDVSAFLLTNLILWIGGILWEYAGIGIFKLWYMIENRSVMAFSLFGARTTVEEMLYYVPFASISILLYCRLYFQKYGIYRTTT